jgi:hypothetical protein
MIVWIGFIWLRTGASGRLLWTWLWAFAFHMTSWVTVSFSRTKKIQPNSDTGESKTINGNYARFEVFTAIKIEVMVFWVLMPCSVVVGYQRFGAPCCLHLHCITTRYRNSEHNLKMEMLVVVMTENGTPQDSSSNNAADTYSGRTGFEYRPGHRLLVSLSRIPGYSFEISRPLPSQSFPLHRIYSLLI